MTGLETAGLAIGTNAANATGDLIFGGLRQKQQLKGQKLALQQQNSAAYDLWLKTNYSAQRRELEKAGLNPGLLYGMGGSGGGSIGSSSAMPTAQGGGNFDIAQAAQLALINAQKEKIEAETANLKNENPKGVQETKSIEIDNEIKSIERDIKKNTWTIEQDARSNEAQARALVADNMVQLALSGKLAEKSEAEIESILLSNAKSKEERRLIIKQMDEIELKMQGMKIEQEILKLEKKLQEQTGLDKNSPWYIKAIGRLFLKMIQ